MRVTNRMLVDNVLKNINNNLARLQKLEYQQSSGLVVSRPSDDPIRVTQALYMRSNLSEQQQHIKNMEDAKNWVDVSDSALDNASQIIHRANEIAINGANGTLPKEARDALADELDELIEHLVQVANTSHAGRFIFAGTETTTISFEAIKDADGKIIQVDYKGNGNVLNWEVSPDVTLDVNRPGDEVFGNIFETLIDLSKDLRDANIGGINDAIKDLNTELDNNLSYRAVYGAKYRRMEMAIAQAKASENNVTELLSNLEDINLAEINMLLSMQSYIYQASLMTGAKVLQPSLVDFMR